MNQTFVLAILMTSVVGAAPSLCAQGEVAASTSSATESRIAAELLARPVTVNVTRASLTQAIDAIATSVKVPIQYTAEMVDAYTRPITMHLSNVPLHVAIDQVLAGTSLRVVPDGSTRLMIVTTVSGNTPSLIEGTVTGKVTDTKTGQPVAHARVSIDGLPRTAETNAEGIFHFTGVTSGRHTVTVRLVGYAKETRTVLVVDDGSVTANVALDRSVAPLDQVVVTGTVTPTSVKAIPNAITVITAQQLEDRGITHIDQLFRGDVPGLFALNVGAASSYSFGGANPFDQVTMYSRGATSLASQNPGIVTADGTNLGTNPIKTYVDGIELADPSYLSQIDPKSIDRIEILTGPQASTIYGSNAINGVMQIFTKRGATTRPQLTVELKTGITQNNLSSALAPQHLANVTVNGMEGRLSYNAGGSWNYTGAWTPAIQATTMGAFGGVRYQYGPATVDMSIRLNQGQNQQGGSSSQLVSDFQTSGYYLPVPAPGVTGAQTGELSQQTLGLTLGYAPTAWWSHQLVVGTDVSNTENRRSSAAYTSSSDTSLSLSQNQLKKMSVAYTTTARIPLTPAAAATVTLGGDDWHALATSLSLSPSSLTGTLTSSYTSVSRQPGHNTGAFVQGQLAVLNTLFFTYGLRAEWNPTYGHEAQPNFAPRYGVSYTPEIGPITAKLRASYGQATRPPGVGERDSQINTVPYQIAIFGPNLSRLASPDLEPEDQRGFEGGLDLYLGTRASLTVTRSNQVVSNLITSVPADSLLSTPAGSAQCANYSYTVDANGQCYLLQYQYQNVASIRNQSWELQGSLNTGPLTTTGTYSWTKSRSLGLTPRFLAAFPANTYPQYQRGATFRYLAEHTWALGLRYGQGSRTVSLNLTGVGQLQNYLNEEYYIQFNRNVRLSQNRGNMKNTLVGSTQYGEMGGDYVLADFNATQRLSSHLEAIVQVHNLADSYHSDYYAEYPTAGRQTQIGIRIR